MAKPVFGERMVSAVGIVDYPSVFEPSKKFDEGKFKVTLLYAKDDTKAVAFLKKLKAECLRVAVQAFGEEGHKVPLPLKDGDKKKSESYEGYYMITAKSKNRPDVVGPTAKRDMQPHDIYSGCLGRVSITPYTYDQAGNQGVSLYLGNFQKVGDGERRGGGGVPADAEFGEMDVFGDGETNSLCNEEEIPF